MVSHSSFFGLRSSTDGGMRCMMVRYSAPCGLHFTHTQTPFIVLSPALSSVSPSFLQCPPVPRLRKKLKKLKAAAQYYVPVQNPEQKIRNPVIFRFFFFCSLLFRRSFPSSCLTHYYYYYCCCRPTESIVVVLVCLMQCLQHKYRGGEGARMVENPALSIYLVYAYT